jgi:tellurite resistance protein TerC
MIGWGAFAVIVLTMLIFDLGVFNRKEKEISMRSALLWSAIWIGSAFLFGIGVYFYRSPADSLQFLTGYLIEESLSVDNLFVFVLIFSYFRVPPAYQRTVLYWGILGAVVMRAIFIAAGTQIVEHFHFVLYIFGLFLVFTGIKLLFKGDDEIHPERNLVLRLCRRLFRVTTEYHGNKFFVRQNGLLYATPLFLVLVVVETTDLIFAVDSIPAVFSIATEKTLEGHATIDVFIVYTSNIFAILGLRSLYFALAGLMDRFHFLKFGLAGILIFVGTKMLVEPWWEIPIAAALAVVIGILATCVIASLLRPRHKNETESETVTQHPN